MSTSASPSPIVPYATPKGARKAWWPYAVVGAFIAMAATPMVQFGGMRLIGFEYGVFVNNAATICPNQVISQVGATINLADGRSFQLDTDPDWLAHQLSQAGNMVFVDTENGIVYGRFARAYCGFDRPQSSQMVTIPLFRKELPSHGRHIIAPLRTSFRASAGR